MRRFILRQRRSLNRDMGPELNIFSKDHQWSQLENDRIHFIIDTWINVSASKKSVKTSIFYLCILRNFPPNHGSYYFPFRWRPTCSVQFNPVAQSCLTLCDPMNRSTSGLPVHHQLPEFTQTHVHWVGYAIQDAISSSVVPFSSCPQFLPGSFLMSQFFAWGGQSIGVSVSASVLPVNTQDWSPLRWTGWISLQSKGLSRVFSNTTVQKHNSSMLSLLHHPTLTSIHDHWKNHSLD